METELEAMVVFAMRKFQGSKLLRPVPRGHVQEMLAADLLAAEVRHLQAHIFERMTDAERRDYYAAAIFGTGNCDAHPAGEVAHYRQVERSH